MFVESFFSLGKILGGVEKKFQMTLAELKEKKISELKSIH